MTLLEKAVYVVAGMMATLIVGIMLAYWWTARVPSRPRGVRADAVFLWAPAVGLPAPRRGDWLGCWQESGQILCQLNDIDGSLEYKGEFVSYDHKGPTAAKDLRFDSMKTRRDAVWIGEALVPLVYLENGDILIPASKYEEGSRLLQRLEQNR
jgi:hypothetical protein